MHTLSCVLNVLSIECTPDLSDFAFNGSFDGGLENTQCALRSACVSHSSPRPPFMTLSWTSKAEDNQGDCKANAIVPSPIKRAPSLTACNGRWGDVQRVVHHEVAPLVDQAHTTMAAPPTTTTPATPATPRSHSSGSSTAAIRPQRCGVCCCLPALLAGGRLPCGERPSRVGRMPVATKDLHSCEHKEWVTHRTRGGDEGGGEAGTLFGPFLPMISRQDTLSHLYSHSYMYM